MRAQPRFPPGRSSALSHLVASGGNGAITELSAGRSAEEQEVLETLSWRRPALWICLLAILSWAAVASAQPEPRRSPERISAAEQTPAAADEDTVREAQPPVLYLRSKEGGLLQAVLGFTLEDFERFMTQRAQLGLGQQPPKFQLQKLVCTGVAGDTHATLSIVLEAAVSDRGWVRAPIRMRQAVLRSKPKYEGPGEQVVEMDATNGEHVLWLRGGGEGTHKITLDVAVPLDRLAGQASLKLDLPRASLSEFTLAVPDPKATATVNEGAILDSTTRAAKETTFKVLGAERDFTITWRKEGAEVAAAAPPQFEAAGQIDARVGARGVHSNVQLSVRGFKARFDSFRMRLPAGATLTAEEQTGYTIEPLEGEKGEPATGGKLYEVRLREVVAGPTVIRFSLDYPNDNAAAQPGFQLAGVELLGAARQAGHVAVRVDDDWQVAWGDLRQARRVDELPAELDHDDIVAGFEYFGQPFLIEGRLLPRETHATVDPRYTVEVSPRLARLEARLTYHVRGAKAFAVEVDLQGWRLDDVEPRNVFDADRVTVETGKPLVIPLLQPTTGEITLVLRAHQDLAANVKRLEFDLPRLKADAVAPAHLVVIPAENVALAMGEGSLQGLTRERAAAVVPGTAKAATDGKQAMLFRGDSGELRFEADLRVQSRVLWAGIRSRLQVDAERATVTETINLRIANEPIEQILLDAPPAVAELMEAGRLEISVDGAPTPGVPLDDDSDSENVQRIRLSLPKPLLGPCQLVLKYPLDTEPFAPGVGVPINVPLVMPADAELSENEFEVYSAPGVKVQSRDDRWTVEPQAGAAPGQAGLRLKSSVPTAEVVLSAHLEERKPHDPTVVQLAWYQTRIAAGERWERAVFQFTSGETQLPLTLPAGADRTQLRVLLDGATLDASAESSVAGLLLPLVGPARRHVLDVSYRSPTRGATPGHIALEVPQLGSDLWIRQSYWQIVLPRDEHIVSWPSHLSSEFQWRLRGLGFVRESTIEQSDLEKWSDAQSLPEAPTDTNRYVFSAVGPMTSLDVVTINRTLLVLAGSGTVLAIGLALLYLPVVRRPAILWVGALTLAVAALVCPEPALLAAQAALLGAALVLMAVAIHSYLNRRRTRPFVVRSGPSSIIDPGSTRTHQRANHNGSSPEPVAIEVAASEGDS